MKFGIMGDTHFDFYFSAFSNSISEKLFHLKIGHYLENAGIDVLLIPGDIGHYNNQNLQGLRLLRQHVKRVVVTFGNHDYYLVSKSIASKYQYKESNRVGGSRARVEEMKTMINAENGIDFVDGNIVEIGGIRIGGATGWYDGSLIIDKTNHEGINWDWRFMSNDANLIYPTGDNGAKFDDLFHEHKHRLDAVYQQCDIMMSHMSPLSEWRQFVEMYGYTFDPNQVARDPHPASKDYRAFYCFDGSEYLERGSMKHWVFGHTHRNFNRTYERADGKNIEIHCNSMGYPKLVKEKNKTNAFTLKVIEV